MVRSALRASLTYSPKEQGSAVRPLRGLIKPSLRSGWVRKKVHSPHNHVGCVVWTLSLGILRVRPVGPNDRAASGGGEADLLRANRRLASILQALRARFRIPFFLSLFLCQTFFFSLFLCSDQPALRAIRPTGRPQEPRHHACPSGLRAFGPPAYPHHACRPTAHPHDAYVALRAAYPPAWPLRGPEEKYPLRPFGPAFRHFFVEKNTPYEGFWEKFRTFLSHFPADYHKLFIILIIIYQFYRPLIYYFVPDFPQIGEFMP